jgi:cell wall-associated NlpC family hydrolase
MRLRRTVTLCLAVLAPAAPANAAAPSWAAAQIRAVTRVGVLGTSPATFQPDAELTQGALAQAIAAADKVLRPETTVVSSVPANATIAGLVAWQVAVPKQSPSVLQLLVDGVELSDYPLAQLDTTKLADGLHTLTVQFSLADGDYAASWTVTVANAPGSVVPPLSGAAQPVPLTTKPERALYKAKLPGGAVTVRQLDAALVNYLGLFDPALTFQTRLSQAGLKPRPGTGSEVVARLLGLRFNHPAGQDGLELLPSDHVTRAEAAYSFAAVLSLRDTSWVAGAAESFTLPALGEWQTRILRAAVSYVGFPYVWGGTSPWQETLYGATVHGGFDCSGFVWRVYKLTSYPGEGGLAGVLRGRTTYEMSGEVGPAKRIHAAGLEPGDVLFFGQGPRSSPSEVDHTGIYLGNGWIIHSSGEGVTIVPFDGWYRSSFAWARRPLHEAGLE